jgi:hypothetical protein
MRVLARHEGDSLMDRRFAHPRRIAQWPLPDELLRYDELPKFNARAVREYLRLDPDA